jgi:hypothetical protein
MLAPLAAAQDQAVLMLGNSYTATNDLPMLVESVLEAGVPAWPDVLTQGLTQGGLLLVDHLAKADGSEGDTPWRDALVTGDTTWDFVVLQEQSQIPGFEETSRDLQNSRQAVADLQALIADQGGETVLLMTWGRRDGDPQNDHIYPDYSTMQDRLSAGYLAYVEQLAQAGEQAWVIPAGLAWQTVHDDRVAAGVEPTDPGTLFHGLYSGDGSHPSLMGSWLIAATALAALTGRSPEGLSGPDGIEDPELTALHDAASRTVFDDPLGAVPYAWAWTWEDWAKTANPGFVDQGALRPLVRVETFGVSLTELAIGDGRLEVVEGAGLGVFGTVVLGLHGPGVITLEGGSAVFEQLTLGSADGGRGELLLREGFLAVDRVGWDGEGVFSMTGGQLIVAEFDGDLVQEAGLLVAANPMLISGSWTMSAEAAFLLEGPAGSVTVQGHAQLSGTFDVMNGSMANSEEVVIVDAESIDNSALTVPAPAGWAVKLRSGGLGQQLVLVPNQGPPDDSSDTGSAGETDEPSCGCVSGPPMAGWLWVLVPWWRRRQP